VIRPVSEYACPVRHLGLTQVATAEGDENNLSKDYVAADFC